MQTLVDIGEGAQSLLLNQILTIAAGGDFWQSGGGISAAGSSTNIQLSVSSVAVNIDGEDHTHGSRPVTLSPLNGNPDPEIENGRCDVIYADSAGVDVIEGVELAKAPQNKDFPSIWQPHPNKGDLVPGVPLWVIYVKEGDTASTDIGSWQTQDRRINAEALDPDIIASLLAEYDTAANGPVETTVENSKTLDGHPPADLTPIMITAELGPDEGEAHGIETDVNEVIHLHRVGSMSRGGSPADTTAQVVSYTPDGGIANVEYTNNAVNEGVDVTFPPDAKYGFRVKNTGGTATLDCTGSYWITIDRV